MEEKDYAQRVLFIRVSVVCEALSPALISLSGDTDAVHNPVRNHRLNVIFTQKYF